jgi:thiamine pyrophosphate-dependent acetolactate synthase large subunit-like protein
MGNVAEVISDTLIENGVERVCGLQDDSLNSIFDSIQ